MWNSIETDLDVLYRRHQLKKASGVPDQINIKYFLLYTPNLCNGEGRMCIASPSYPPQTPSGCQNKNCMQNPYIHMQCPISISLWVWLKKIKLINHPPLHSGASTLTPFPQQHPRWHCSYCKIHDNTVSTATSTLTLFTLQHPRGHCFHYIHNHSIHTASSTLTLVILQHRSWHCSHSNIHTDTAWKGSFQGGSARKRTWNVSDVASFRGYVILFVTRNLTQFKCQH